jgi:hypothetical protein
MKRGFLIILALIGLLLALSESNYFPWSNILGGAFIWICTHYWPKGKIVGIERFNPDYLKNRR